MAGDPITTGLIISAVATSAGAAQQVGNAKSAATQQKRNQQLASAKDNADIAQAEQGRQQQLRKRLSQQRASLAAAGIDSSSQTALAGADKLLSESNQDSARHRSAGFGSVRASASGALNRQIFTSLSRVGGQFGRFPQGGV